MDSGAGANVASLKNRFPGAVLNARDPSKPTVKLSTASAEILESDRDFDIPATTTNGHATCTTYVDADVDMPILSVAMLCEDGSQVMCGKKGGVILHPDGERTRFHKRRGVYFLKMLVKKSLVKSNDMDFVRPGSA